MKKHLNCELIPVCRDHWCLTEREGEMSKKNKRLFKIRGGLFKIVFTKEGLLKYLCSESYWLPVNVMTLI